MTTTAMAATTTAMMIMIIFLIKINCHHQHHIKPNNRQPKDKVMTCLSTFT